MLRTALLSAVVAQIAAVVPPAARLREVDLPDWLLAHGNSNLSWEASDDPRVDALRAAQALVGHLDNLALSAVLADRGPALLVVVRSARRRMEYLAARVDDPQPEPALGGQAWRDAEAERLRRIAEGGE